MKKALEKFVTTILIILILFNFIYSNYIPVYAVDDVETLIVNVMGGVVGIFTWIPRLIAMAIGWGVNVITAQIAYLDDKTATATDTSTATLTPFNIFFNEVQLLDVNFLDTDVGGTTGIIREAVAQWYYIMRLIASIILLVILIFVGVKMALSSVAEEKAIYKKTLVDWATSLALVFVLQYIIMFTVNANSAIVQALKPVVDTTGLDNTIKGIALEALGISWRSIGATIVYCMFVFQTLAFLFTYIKRMLTIGFLIIISPLISITYSIDRMGDGKAQALNTWLKEFIYGILIQPFHCVMYMAFLDTAFNLLKTPGDNDLANAILAIICMKFIDEGEKIVRKIFGFENASSVSPLQTAAAAGMVMKGGQMAAGAASNVRKGINMAKENGLFASMKKDGSKIKNSLNQRKEKKLDKAMQKQFSGLEVGSEEYKEKRAELAKGMEEKVANRPIRKIANSVKNKREAAKNAKREAAINKQMQENFKHREGGLEAFRNSATDEEWENARKSAGETVDKNAAEKKEKRAENGRKIKGAVGKVGNVAGKAWNSNTGRYIRKTMIPAGIGLAIGSMALGGTDAFTSFGVGNTVFKGAQAFALSSPKTIAFEGAKYVDGRTSSTEETVEKCKEVYQKGEAGQLSDELKDIVKDMKAMINEMNKGRGENDKINFGRVQSMIAYEAAANPETFDLNKILSETIGQDAFSNPDLVKKAQDLANNAFDSNLYKQMKNGADLGLSVEEFAERVDKMITHSASSSSEETATPEPASGASYNDAVPEEVKVVIENVMKHEDVTTIINEVDKGDLNKLADIKTGLELKLQDLRGTSRQGDTAAEESIRRLNSALHQVNTRLGVKNDSE